MTSIIQVAYGYMRLYLRDETNREREGWGVEGWGAGDERRKERKDESESEDIRCVSEQTC